MLRPKTKPLWSLLILVILAGLIAASREDGARAAQTGGNTDTPTPTQTGTQTLTAAFTFTPVAPGHPVISEFRSRGPNGDNDEFVELYNPTGAAINIGSWSVRRSSNCGSNIFNLFFIPSNIVLQAGQHYLAVATGSSIGGADQTFTPGIADDGGVALLNASSQVVDQVGMCISTTFHEGSNLSPLIGNSDQSYERRPGGLTACYDTDNNAGDFALKSPPFPQGRGSAIALCSGISLSTITYTPTTTYTRTPTFTATTIPGSVVINEFLPHPHSDWNLDGTMNVGDEYIELMNMGAESINIKNWTLDTGQNTRPYALPDITMESHQILVFYHADTDISLSDGGSSVRLVKSDGHTADIFNYPPVEAADRTWCRLPDGNGGWAFACNPSPGRPNIPAFTPTEPTLTATPAANLFPDCGTQTSPGSPSTGADCNGTGGGISRPALVSPVWLPGSRKWGVYIE